MGKLERDFQRELIKDLKTIFPDCIVLKNDPNYIQGIPDLTILNGNKWATLECKKSKTSSKRPNQSYYVDKMNGMSYSAFISPGNKEDILNDLKQTFKS